MPKKEGYFLGARMLNTTAGKIAYTRVELLKKNLIQIVSSDVSHEISIDNQAKITLPANGFVDESGNSYSGNISVCMPVLNLEKRSGNLAQN